MELCYFGGLKREDIKYSGLPSNVDFSPEDYVIFAWQEIGKRDFRKAYIVLREGLRRYPQDPEGFNILLEHTLSSWGFIDRAKRYGRKIGESYAGFSHWTDTIEVLERRELAVKERRSQIRLVEDNTRFTLQASPTNRGHL